MKNLFVGLALGIALFVGGFAFAKHCPLASGCKCACICKCDCKCGCADCKCNANCCVK